MQLPGFKSRLYHLTSCVTLDRLLDLSGFQAPYLLNRNNNRINNHWPNRRIKCIHPQGLAPSKCYLIVKNKNRLRQPTPSHTIASDGEVMAIA